MKPDVYLICDEGNNVSIFSDVRIFNRTVPIAAIFINEGDALETLYAIEKNSLSSKPLRVKKIPATMMAIDEVEA